jgi:hypothetical protein
VGTALPKFGDDGSFLSVTRTHDELSVVCSQQNAESHIAESSPTQKSNGDRKVSLGWKCLQVCGPLEFDIVGVIATLSTCLAEAEISLFTVSTYDTDYILVKNADLEAALKALVESGHAVRSAS